MTDPHVIGTEAYPVDGHRPPAGAGGVGDAMSAKVAELRAQRPEVIVAAAFIGGAVLAMLLKRMGRR